MTSYRLFLSIAGLLAVILAGATQADTGKRNCTAIAGGEVVCGDAVFGFTQAEYEAGLKQRTEEIRAEAAAGQVQLVRLMALTERATEAEKARLRAQIETVETQKHTLEQQNQELQRRLLEPEQSYLALLEKLTEAKAALATLGPLASNEEFDQAQEALTRGDVLEAEQLFISIADRLSGLRERLDEKEGSARYGAGRLAEERVAWREAYSKFARAASLQPAKWRYARAAGRLADAMGAYSAAASYKEAVVDAIEVEFGESHKEMATALHNLAETYRSLARYEEAEALNGKAIAIGEKTLGKEHPVLAVYNNNLAIQLEATGRNEEAEALYRKSLAITEKTLGKEHPKLAIRYNNLAGLLETTGRNEEAEALYRKSLAITEKTLGKQHHTLAIRYSNLAGVLRTTGRNEEAGSLYRKALAIMTSTLGADHPNTQRVTNNLNSLLEQIKKEYPAK